MSKYMNVYFIKTVKKEGKNWLIDKIRFVIKGEVVLECSDEILSDQEGRQAFMRQLSDFPEIMRDYGKSEHPAVIEHIYAPRKKPKVVPEEEAQELLSILAYYNPKPDKESENDDGSK